MKNQRLSRDFHACFRQLRHEGSFACYLCGHRRVDTFECVDTLLTALRTHLILCERAGTWSSLSGVIICEGLQVEAALSGDERLLVIAKPRARVEMP